MLRERHIEPVTVEECYETGLPSWYAANGLRWRWYSWVLCEVMGSPGNPPHYVLCTHFRSDNYRKPGPAKSLSVTCWNPSYEDNEHRENILVSNFHFWKPVAVLLLETNVVK